MSEVEHQSDKDLAREAARIFLRLTEQPNDANALAAKDAFLARGQAEQQIYSRMSQRWQTSKRHGKRRRTRNLIAVLALITVGYFAYGPARITLLADVTTGRTAEPVILASGDRVILDADSAISDETGEDERVVNLLEGAAIFQVSRGVERFRVTAGGLEAVVLGTEFEVAYSGAAMLVAVAEGAVEVHAKGETWRLEPGHRLTIGGSDTPEVVTVDPARIAAWRQDRFTAADMTLAELAAIIDRRLPGQVLITDTELAEVRVSGGVDLTQPLRALRALSAAAGAKIVAAPPLATVIMPKD